MSLSQEPAFSTIKNYFVCGYTDITDKEYSGVSGRHEKFGNAISTTNGAGPRNLQMFMMSSDGTVLHCLPGYWDPRDLVTEARFAWQLNEVWKDKSLSKSQKDQMFKSLQLAHIDQHSPQMTRRSHMQGFDQDYEAQHRLHTSDTIRDPNLVLASMQKTGKPARNAFKTTDVLMHERMAKRPFIAFDKFDTEKYSDYGLTKYDKHEDQRDVRSGQRISEAKGPTIGDTTRMMKGKQKKEVFRSRGWGDAEPASNSGGWGNTEASKTPKGWGAN